MPNFLLIGLVAVVPIVVLGTALIHHWASVQWRREEPIRHRQAVLDRLFEAVDQALDPEPSVSFVGVQEIDALREAGLLEPADDDFVEEIAKVVITTRHDESEDGKFVVGPVSADAEVPPERVVQPSEVLAAKILIEIAESKAERPSPLAQRIADATSGSSTEQPAAATEKKPAAVTLKRTA